MPRNATSKNVGSAYLNVTKNAPPQLQANLDQVVKWLTDNKVTLTLSIKNSQGTYSKFTGLFNLYKRTPNDPDLVIRPYIKRVQPVATENPALAVPVAPVTQTTPVAAPAAPAAPVPNTSTTDLPPF